MKLTFKLMLLAVTAVVLTLMSAPLVCGEQSSPAPSQERTQDRAAQERRERDRQREELQRRQFALRMLEKEARRPTVRPAPQLALAQIREDFWHIQVVNKQIAQAVVSGASLDPKFIAKSASEIKKRAGRLKYNLMLAEPEKDTKRPKAEVGTEPEQLQSSLSALSELIIGFVSNPMFQKANTVDAQLSAKARADLDGIIELSDGIKKSSEKLNKIAQKR